MSQTYKEVDSRHGIPSLPSCVDGWVLSPVHYTWEVWGTEAQTQKDLPFTEWCHRHSGTFWDMGLCLSEKMSPVCLVMWWCLCAPVPCVFTICKLPLSCKWKPAPQSRSNWKEKTQLGNRDKVVIICPISASETWLALSKGSAMWLTV